MNIFRSILHCKNATSDKVFIIEVNNLEGKYIVTTSWGRRQAPRLSSQVRLETKNQLSALNEAQKIINGKMNGKNKYKLAPHDLEVTGYKAKATTFASVHIDNQKPSDQIVTLSPQIGTRKLRI